MNWGALKKMNQFIATLFEKGLKAFQIVVLYWLLLTPAKETSVITGFCFHAHDPGY